MIAESIIESSPSVDEVGVLERASRFTRRSIKKESKLSLLKLALSMIDLTTLDGADTPDKVRRLCYKALHLHHGLEDIPTVAAVCVYAPLVPIAKEALAGADINIAAVATGFPSGMAPLQMKIDETKFAVDKGATEIDMVISRGKFLSGEYQAVADEIAAIKEACGKAHLKVIIETGELKTLDNIRRASDLSIQAGADFIKTSTGKVSPAATLPFTLVMLQSIRDHYYKTGKKIGMKPAGGISTAKQSLQYLVMLQETLGDAWMTPELFRFGASRLANDILMQIAKQQTGVYQSQDYFSKD